MGFSARTVKEKKSKIREKKRGINVRTKVREKKVEKEKKKRGFNVRMVKEKKKQEKENKGKRKRKTKKKCTN